LSYAHEDKDFAERIAIKLRKKWDRHFFRHNSVTMPIMRNKEERAWNAVTH